MRKKKVLIFPAGEENSINIYKSLKYSIHFDVYGASSRRDHAEFIYPAEKLIIRDLYIHENDFIAKFNTLIKEYTIDYIIPTHDEIASYLMKNAEIIHAIIVCSPYETAHIAENKKLTYEALKGEKFCPKIYMKENIAEIKKYPIFLKPYIGAGGKGTAIVHQRKILESKIEENKDVLICEYLPGEECTVDCFTDRKGKLLFVGARTRERITNGISYRSQKIQYTADIGEIAERLNKKFEFRGAWFFQLKKNDIGEYRLLEFSVRQSGTMIYYKQQGVNFALLSLFDLMECDVEILENKCDLLLDRGIETKYKLKYTYNTVYVDFDDTLLIREKVNTLLMQFLYQCINNQKRLILLTKHSYDIYETLKKNKISELIFDEIIILSQGEDKADYINDKDAIFIDNYFYDRKSVYNKCKIPVFDVDAVECLLDETLF